MNAFLFQIAEEKSCGYWLITHIKKYHMKPLKFFFFELLFLKTPQKLCLVSEVHFIQYVFVIVVFRSPRLPELNYPVLCRVFLLLSFLPSNAGLKCCLPLCCCAVATFLSINVISTFCTQPQYQFSALFRINWHALYQSKSGNLFMCVI